MGLHMHMFGPHWASLANMDQYNQATAEYQVTLDVSASTQCLGGIKHAQILLQK